MPCIEKGLNRIQLTNNISICYQLCSGISVLISRSPVEGVGDNWLSCGSEDPETRLCVSSSDENPSSESTFSRTPAVFFFFLANIVPKTPLVAPLAARLSFLFPQDDSLRVPLLPLSEFSSFAPAAIEPDEGDLLMLRMGWRLPLVELCLEHTL